MNSVSPILIVRFSHGKGVLFLRESAARVRHAVKVAQWNVFLLHGVLVYFLVIELPFRLYLWFLSLWGPGISRVMGILLQCENTSLSQEWVE
jgi:hypothetical protein